MEQEIQRSAEKEMARMKEVFAHIKVDDPKDKSARDFYDFANNYFKDGQYFYKEKKFIESFEAFVISWAYIDIGLKLGIFSVPEDQEKWFTA